MLWLFIKKPIARISSIAHSEGRSTARAVQVVPTLLSGGPLKEAA
ncbi:hypothetical protein QUA13_00335 [Microcoleus sp. S28C3]